MGASLSNLGSSSTTNSASGRLKAIGPPALATPARPRERRAYSGNSVKKEELGDLTTSTGDGLVTWKLSGASLVQLLAGSNSFEPDDGASNGSGRTGPVPRCTSQPFCIPDAALPAACMELLAQHRWCLVAEVADWRSMQLSIYLQWLGGPSYPGTHGTSVICDYLLDASCFEVATGAGKASHRRLLASRRNFLQHAFNKHEPEAGLPNMLSAVGCTSHTTSTVGNGNGSSALEPAGAEAVGLALELEARLHFGRAVVHVEAPLLGLVVHEKPLLLKVSEDPCLLLAEGFLSPQECADVRQLGGPRLRRSKVSAGDETPLRTSWGMFITGELQQHPVARHIDQRVEELMRLACSVEGRRPLVLGEATQIVRYDPGQFYALHMDNRAGDCAKRAATVMVYLSDVEAGGATSFPRSSGYPLDRVCTAGQCNAPAAPDSPTVGKRTKQRRPAGLRVEPREGRAVIFWSRMPNGEEDKASIHEAEKVVAGTKWIATRWCREV